MKNRSLVLKTAAVTFSLTLLVTYVVARATGLIGKRPEPVQPVVSTAPVAPSTPGAAEAKPIPVRTNDYFVGSKSGPIALPEKLLEPKKFPDLIPGQQVTPAQPK